MLFEEMESLKELLQSPIEDNVSIALAILDNPENLEVKKALLDPFAEMYNGLYWEQVTYQNIATPHVIKIIAFMKIHNEFNELIGEDDTIITPWNFKETKRYKRNNSLRRLEK